MVLQPTPAAPRRRFTLFYGWAIVAIASLAHFLSGAGQTFAVSAFIDSWLEDFQLTRTQISSLYSTATLLAGFTLVYIGRLVDRHGERLMLTVVSLLFGLACLWVAQARGMATLFIGFLLIRILGQGCLSLIPFSLAPRWFVAQRGWAVAAVTFGGMLSSAVFPYISLKLIELRDWRFAWYVWAVLLAGVLAPVAWKWVRNRPEDMGLLPDNARPEPGGPRQDVEVRKEPSLGLDQVFRLPVFWFLLVLNGIPAMVGAGVIFHHMSIMASNGLSLGVAVMVFTLSAIASFPATFVAGYVCNRFPSRHALALTLALSAVSTMWLLITTTTLQAVIVAVQRGFLLSFQSTVMGVVWPDYFGRENLGSIRGAATTSMVVGSALGPLPFGLAYDLTGGYVSVIVLMSALCAVGAVVAPFLKPPQRPA